MIPFSPPDIREEDIAEVADTLRGGWITTGTRTAELAGMLRDRTGAAGAYCLSSGTAALAMALRMLGIRKGDEVILPAYTFTATAAVVIEAGATPVIVDSLTDSCLIDPAAVETAVTSRTKAIMGVDVGGVMADYSALFDIAEEKRSFFNPSSPLQSSLGRIAIIADAAHSFGGERRSTQSGGGRPTRQWIKAGNAADLTAFSFHAVKNLTTAEGGALTWSDIIPTVEAQRFCRLHSCHGIDRDAMARRGSADWEYDVPVFGGKCNMPDTLAALALNQMRRYDDILRRRHEMIRLYDSLLAGSPVKPMRHTDEGYRSSGHLYMTFLPGDTDRDDTFRRMHDAGICCNVHFKPLTLMTAYRKMGFRSETTPRATALFSRELTLPLYTRLTDTDITYVAETLKGIVEG